MPNAPTPPAASTRDRILDVATDLFARRGYRGATIRSICTEAGVNVASVNYHFRTKQELYAAVFAAAFDARAKPMIDRADSVRDAATWEATLRDWVQFVLRLFLRDTPQETRIRRLVANERAQPSSVCPLLFDRFFLPVTECLQRLLRLALPADVSADVLRSWLICVQGQCTVFLNRDPPWDSLVLCPELDRDVWIDRMTAHIVGSVTCRLRFRAADDAPTAQPPAPPCSNA